MSKGTGFIIFALGAAVGSVGTWYYVKKKYEQYANEEIASVKSRYANAYEKPVEKTEEIEASQEVANKAKEKPSVVEYARKLSEEGYFDYSEVSSSDQEKTVPNSTAPYVISPDEFREYDDYDVISLTYYSDHILTDENDEIVEDVENTVGFESLTHFGEYEDDSVFVRNERLKVDYEILLDQREYSDVIKTKPYLKEV